MLPISLTNPASIELNEEKAFEWLMKGAQPSDSVKAMLSYRGIMLKKHLQIGVVKGALSQEQADQKLADWKAAKATKIQSKRDDLAKARQDAAKTRKEAEAKVRESRAEAIKKKAEAAIAAASVAEQAPAAEGEAEPSAPAPAEEA